MLTDLCEPREFCQSRGYRDLQWMCDLWRDCANDSSDNCSSHLSPQPGKKPYSEQALPIRTGRVPYHTLLIVHGWVSLSSSCDHFKESSWDSQLVVALYTSVI